MSKDSQFKDHFSKATGYAAYRPVYPESLATYLASISPSTGMALDCACGTGQLSVLLADQFTKVVATDGSAAQIQNAKVHPHIEYKVEVAEESGLATASVDLITVAQAAHWLNLEKFYEEIKRIAKPHAVIALISYGIMHVEGDEVEVITNHFYANILGPYWPHERKHVENGYKDFSFPFSEISPPQMDMTARWNMEAVLGYIDTWSAVREIEKVSGRAPMNNLKIELLKVWGDPEKKRTISWPLSFRIGYVS